MLNFFKMTTAYIFSRNWSLADYESTPWVVETYPSLTKPYLLIWIRSALVTSIFPNPRDWHSDLSKAPETWEFRGKYSDFRCFICSGTCWTFLIFQPFRFSTLWWIIFFANSCGIEFVRVICSIYGENADLVFTNQGKELQKEVESAPCGNLGKKNILARFRSWIYLHHSCERIPTGSFLISLLST